MVKKILLLANRDFVIYNFRYELVQKLIEEKYEVAICLPYGPKVDIMTDAGAAFIPLNIDGRGKNPFKDLVLMSDLKKIFSEYKPDIILMYTTKVDIYGGIVAGRLHIPYLLNVSGLGTATGENGLLQSLMIYLYKKAVKNAECVFFQNKENMEFFHQKHIVCKKEKLIPGSGVNVERWSYLEYPSEDEGIHFLFIARVIKQKGIEEYLETAKEIKGKYPYTYFHIMGPCDGDYGDVLKQLGEQGIIQYHGMVQDTRDYLRIAHCTIHPSFYPEGISNVCLESAASGRPVITTDNPGCRDTVEDFVTGYIVKEKNPKSFVREVEHFLHLSWEQKRSMGMKGREKVKREFDRELVINAYMKEIDSYD
ncbi:MAG: glycosyltransferase family 4 protein [Butyrivibrio sp.]|nr:glycosyltransferase family 4 protein [Butyrivibrio sp.]